MLTRRAKAYNCFLQTVSLSPAISSQFIFGVCVATKIAKINKTPYFESSRSKSSILIRLKSSSLMLVVVGSMPMPICNRFHERLANNGGTGVPLFDALVRRFP